MVAKPRPSQRWPRVICKVTCSFLRRAARFACCEPEIASLTGMVEDGFVGYSTMNDELSAVVSGRWTMGDGE